MAWFKVDDRLSVHPKVLKAGNAAMGLWVRAGSWSMANLTDGFIPDHAIRLLDGKPAQAKALTDAGLWRKVKGGYQFHEWAEFQPSAQEEREKREAAAERQRRSRRNKAGRYVTGVVTRDDTRESHHPDPARPVPTPGKDLRGDLTGDYGAGTEPPLYSNRCGQHGDWANPPNCGACADARKAAVLAQPARLRLVDAQPCLVHAEPDVVTCRGCAADAKAAPGS